MFSRHIQGFRRHLQGYRRNVRQVLRHRSISHRSHTEHYGVLELSEEVRTALHHGSPVVALETTIVTHGMPHPHNISTAVEVEEIVRQHGAMPATIAVLGGKIHVGLSKGQLEYLAETTTGAVKTSRRDLPYVLSQGLNGGTTVSGTMVAAAMAGISVFATGGIGGVHRGAETSLDISADLTELGRTPVAVVSSGVKSILDIGLTLEYLETQGVCVATFGTSRHFPAFFTRHSGHMAPYNVSTALQAAQMIYSGICASLQTGTVIAVPIPEQYDSLGQQLETVIQSVVKEAKEKGIKGKEVTPFILGRVNEQTKGKSLEANIALVKNNAAVASQIAVELSALKKRGNNGNSTGTQTGDSDSMISTGDNTSSHSSVGSLGDSASSHSSVGSSGDSASFSTGRQKGPTSKTSAGKKVVVIGGSIVDFYAHLNTPEFEVNGATYPGSVRQSFGGVGRNLADALTRLGVQTKFISAIGDDSHRMAFEASNSHMDLSGVARLEGGSTATYCALMRNSGDLLFGIGDMDIHATISPQYVSRYEADILSADFVCVDGNVSIETLEYVCLLCKRHSIPVLFEPTDINKAGKVFMTAAHQGVTYTSPNLNELRTMVNHLTNNTLPASDTAELRDCDTVLHECTSLVETVASHIPVTMVTLGHHGVLLCRHGDRANKLPARGSEIRSSGGLVMEYFPASPSGGKSINIVSVSGAGDCLVSGFVSGLLSGLVPSLCVRRGLRAAQLSLQSAQAVPIDLTPGALDSDMLQQYMDVEPRVINTEEPRLKM